MSRTVALILALTVFTCCKNPKTDEPTDRPTGPTRFERMPSAATGVHFSNDLVEKPELNVLNYLYFYNGGGVAAGDVNSDGLCDLFFTSNMGQPKLYLNRGGFKFDDVTEASGISVEKGWTTGATIVDVDGDGRLDIYVSRVGKHPGIEGHNLLFLNRGNNAAGQPTFEEDAYRWGLAFEGYSTQAAFLDYDLDGDLDVYILRHSVHANGTFGTVKDLRNKPHPTAGDKLMRNDGDHFTDVTQQAGILSPVTGYGLGVTVGDVNLDGWPDIYVGNDFHEDDFLYLNNGNGTFRESLNDCIGHTSRYTMGTDIGDLNNDGLPDILTLDMLPEDPQILKSSAAEEPFDIYEYKLSFGYNYQYTRNNLQLGCGVIPQKGGKNLPFFSEIACSAGIYNTDWSWSALVADLDLDGWRDIHISNGIMRRSNDLDYAKFVEVDSIQFKLKEEGIDDNDLKMIKMMPSIKVPNFAYQNRGGTSFADQSRAWGLDDKSFSNGSVYADLDNDGDLDLAINNINEEAFVYQNKTVDAGKIAEQGRHFLKIKFEGAGKNTSGIGARVVYRAANRKQVFQENFPTRGFESSVEPNRMIIGLGEKAMLDSLTVVWPKGDFEVLTNVAADQVLTVKESAAKGRFDFKKLIPPVSRQPLFADVSESFGLNWKHTDPKFVEFNRERLIPNMNSTEGPKLAVGDVNGDGLEDFFVGGAKRQAGQVFIQNKAGKFTAVKTAALEKDSLNEDVGAALFDADGDKDLDLMVVSGGNEFRDGDPALQPRLYKNDGKGGFLRENSAFAGISFNGSCAAPCDFDHDGDVDLFLGGRSVAWNYGKPPASYLMENDGRGVFKNTIADRAAGLQTTGFVKSAIWADLDGDGWQDLAVAGDWMPLSIFFNKKGRLEPAKNTGLEQMSGWWNCLSAADLDGDGDLDFVAGNYGLNSKIAASPDKPVRLYAADFDKNGQMDQLLTYDYKGTELMFASRDEMAQQIPSIKKKYLHYSDYSKAKAADFFGQAALDAAQKWKVEQLASVWVENLGGGKFSVHELPRDIQFSSIEAISIKDFDGNGSPDLLMVGNFFDANPEIGRLDGNYGSVVLNDGKGHLTSLPMAETGLRLRGQFRDLAWVKTSGGGEIALAARNNGAIAVLKRQIQKSK